MRRKAGLAGRLLVLLAIILAGGAVVPQLAADERGPDGQLPDDAGAPTVTVRAASGATIGFTTQNGQTIDDVPPQTLELPHLVLYRNGDLTPPEERTLILTASDLVLPSSWVTVTLTLETYHSDPDSGGSSENRITVWRESRRLVNSSDLDEIDGTIIFEHEFGATFETGTERIATPTDYFRYDLTVEGQESTSVFGRVPALSQDFAFLLENQWRQSLVSEQMAAGKAALEGLAVYYCDMFVFQRDLNDPASRLRRGEIPSYVQRELGPAMLEAFRIQTEEWGFGWQEAWTSHRAEDGKERLSVALSDGEIWFHGEAPTRGHSGISLNTKGGASRNYETLTDGLLSTFHHELFHNLQVGLVHGIAGHGDVDGKDDTERFFSEGTAVLAESVARAGTEFAQTSGPRTYISHANGFIGPTDADGELNASYAGMSPYRAGIYWRFLYEQCGGMKNGTEDPGAGMRLIRQVLEALYARAVVHRSPSTALEYTVPAVMDQVLEGPAAESCPFQTFRESLQRFAWAIYQLRLADGRCSAPGVPTGCGFYDPNHLYVSPPASTIIYSGERIVFSASDQAYPRGIRSSFGIDFVEVKSDPGAQGQALAIEFSGDPQGVADFGVEIWGLIDDGIPYRAETALARVVPSVHFPATAVGRRLIFEIPEIDVGQANKLVFILTRLDSEEDADPVGAYTIVLEPGRSP